MEKLTHLNTRQLAERWKLHPITLCKWRVEGTGPKFMKLGRAVVYLIEDVEAFEKAQLKRSTAG